MACVIFSTVFIESSIMIPYYCGLDEEEAQYFQNIASHTVMDNLSLWNIDDEGNNTPPYPPTIYGNANGKKSNIYYFNISTTDINDDDVYYLVDWGDEINEKFGPFLSGEEVSLSHSWSKQGNYIIKVKAIDVYEAESDWATLEVSIPKSKQFNIFEEFLERLFKRFSMLDQIIGFLQLCKIKKISTYSGSFFRQYLP